MQVLARMVSILSRSSFHSQEKKRLVMTKNLRECGLMQDRLTAGNVCAQRPRGALPAPFCMTFWSCYGEAKPRYEHPLGADLKARWMAYCADFWNTPGIDYQLFTIGRNLNQPGQRAGFSFPSTSQPWPCHGWKQCQGHARKPHAERSAASTERVRTGAKPSPLMLMEAREPIGKGEGRRA